MTRIHTPQNNVNRVLRVKVVNSDVLVVVIVPVQYGELE